MTFALYKNNGISNHRTLDTLLRFEKGNSPVIPLTKGQKYETVSMSGCHHYMLSKWISINMMLHRATWWSLAVNDDTSVTSWIFLLCFNVPVFIILGFTVSQLSFLVSRLASVLLWVSREASCLIGWSRARKPIRSCYWLVFRGRSYTDTERLNANWVWQNALEPARGRLPWALLGAKPHGKCDIAYISRMSDIL